ncbi:MAG: hypothetical protein IH598_02755 [Bacteroidales bacterium]|nr:hypothetical protein [Bacteroidales bacterium]
MGKVSAQMLNGFSGRLGNVVGCLRYGKYYLRTLPEKVNQPNTPKQMAQRMRFRLVQEHLAPYREFLRIGFGGFATGRSAYSAALSHNLRQAITGDYPNLSVDPAKVLLSHGSLPDAQLASLVAEESSLLFLWQPADENNPGDRVITIAFCKAFMQAVWKFSQTKREDGEPRVELPAGWRNNDVSGYIGFYNDRILGAGIKPEWISDSSYAGTVIFRGVK